MSSGKAHVKAAAQAAASHTRRDNSDESDMEQYLSPENYEEMEYEGPKGKKREKPKKKKGAVVVLEDDDSNTSDTPRPKEKRSRPETEKETNVGLPVQEPASGDGQSATSVARPTPQEDTLRTQIGKAQGMYLKNMTAVGAMIDERSRGKICESFQQMTDIAIKLLEENAFLKGRLMERGTTKEPLERSYLEAAKGAGSQGASSEGEGGEQDKERQSTTNVSKTENTKQALLVFPKKPIPNREHRQVVDLLRATLSPCELGLVEPEVRMVKGGTVVLSTSSEGLEKLEKEINRRPDLKEKLEAKKPYRRNPQIIVRGVPASIDDFSLKAAIINQNQLEATSEEIKIIRTFPNRNETKSVVLEVTPQLFKQMKPRSRLLIEWSSCTIAENLHILFCKRCATYGHAAGRCTAMPRCPICGDSHLMVDCDAQTRRHCWACIEHAHVRPPQAKVDHSGTDKECPTYQWYLGRLRQKINYG